MFCQQCGVEVPVGAAACSQCSLPVPGTAGALSNQIGQQIKVSSRAAASALSSLARDPVSGMVTSWQALGSARAQAAGIALCAGFAIVATIGMLLGARGFFGGTLGYSGGSAATFFKVLLAMLVPPATLALASLGIRRVLSATSGFAADLFVAGASLAPLALAILAAGILGMGNFEVIALLLLVALCYLVLMLHRGLTAIGGLSERAGPPAVPVLIALSTWLTKIALAAFF